MSSTSLSSPPRSSRPLASSLAVVAGLLRLLPHPPNFTPVGALGLFAGARLAGGRAFALPLLVMAVSDVLLSLIFGYPLWHAGLPWVYASILINVGIGRWLRHTESPWLIGSASLLASAQFFVLTNFGVWATGGLYPPTVAGLMTCYTLAIPFFGWTLLGDVCYSAVFFGAHAWLSRTQFPAERVKEMSLSYDDVG
ncbi:MAG: DUF6580 family putative transport protein [Gemmataceae bacterium]